MDKGNSVVTQEDREVADEAATEYLSAVFRGEKGRFETLAQAFANYRIASTTTAQATIDELRGALKLWIAYDEGDQADGVTLMLDYARALEATRTTLARTGDA